MGSRAVLLGLVVLSGCVHTPRKAEIYFRVGAGSIDENASMLVLPFYVSNLPGNNSEYHAAISAGMQGCGRHCVPLHRAREALASARLLFADLPNDLYLAASRGEVDLSKIPPKNLKRSFAALLDIVDGAARQLGVRFRPRYLLVVRVDGLGYQAKKTTFLFRYRVTAAICDLQKHKLHAVASFVRLVDESWLVSEMAQLGLRVIAVLSRPPTSPKRRASTTVPPAS